MEKLVYNDLFTGEQKALKTRRTNKLVIFATTGNYRPADSPETSCINCIFRFNNLNCEKIGRTQGAASRISHTYTCNFFKAKNIIAP